MTTNTINLFDHKLLVPAIADAFRKLSPRQQFRNPVMFVVFVCSVLTTGLWAQALAGHGEAPVGFILWIAIWLWFTLLFANFAEALAEGRGKAQAASLRGARRDVVANKIPSLDRRDAISVGSAHDLRKGDLVIVSAGEFVPGDGDVLEGAATVDESAVTGESAPVIRESGGDRSSVTGGTRVLSDWIVVRISSNPGESFLDRMIAMVEGASRRKTPNEIALTILLAKFTLIFLLACSTLLPYSLHAVTSSGHGEPVTLTVLVALLVCLIPTTIGGLLSAIGIAGHGSHDPGQRHRDVRTRGRAAGDVDVLLLDKTGTITLGNRQAVAFHPAPGVELRTLADAAQLASLADETPEGRSIVVLAKQSFGLRERALNELEAHFVRSRPTHA
jgi:K+-transporting ATPase ATPase B chain